MKRLVFVILIVLTVATIVVLAKQNKITPTPTQIPLSILSMRQRSYPGSDLKIEQTLEKHSNYNQYTASYYSDGLKIYGLLDVPTGTKPATGWPVILFNHGYLDPPTYISTAHYVAYLDAFTNNGYIVFEPDYRGHGKSEGVAEGAYYSPDYAIDDLNALASIEKYENVDSTRIGVWGHSMGGNITLRDLVITHHFKAAVIWGGVVGSYNDILYNWERKVPFKPTGRDLALRINHKQEFLDKYGTPSQNPTFWNSIDPTTYLSDVTTPIQLDTGGEDEEVPVDFSKSLRDKLQTLNKTVEYYEYPGADHNISQAFNQAMEKTLSFFDKYLKHQ